MIVVYQCRSCDTEYEGFKGVYKCPSCGETQIKFIRNLRGEAAETWRGMNWATTSGHVGMRTQEKSKSEVKYSMGNFG